jgi:hypothetical protein
MAKGKKTLKEKSAQIWRIAQQTKDAEHLAKTFRQAAKIQKKEVNNLMYAITGMIAFASDVVDWFPIPGVDFIPSFVLKLMYSMLLIFMTTFSKRQAKKILLKILLLILGFPLDLILGNISLLEWVSMLSTTSVVLSYLIDKYDLEKSINKLDNLLK